MRGAEHLTHEKLEKQIFHIFSTMKDGAETKCIVWTVILRFPSLVARLSSAGFYS